MYVYIYIYILCRYVYIYIYIYRERDIDIDIDIYVYSNYDNGICCGRSVEKTLQRSLHLTLRHIGSCRLFAVDKRFECSLPSDQ